MKPGTQADLRRELLNEHGINCTPAGISKLVTTKDYRIVKTRGGKIKIAETIKRLIESNFGKRTKPIEKESVEPETVSTKTKPVNGESETTEEMPTQGEVDDNPLKETDERGKIERYLSFQKYEKERIANEKSKKELVNFSEIAEAVFKFLRPFRDDVQAIPERVGGTSRLAKTKHKSENIIRKETDRIMLSRIGKEYAFDDQLKKKIIEILKRSLNQR